jgi:hypothetical protein
VLHLVAFMCMRGSEGKECSAAPQAIAESGVGGALGVRWRKGEGRGRVAIVAGPIAAGTCCCRRHVLVGGVAGKARPMCG